MPEIIPAILALVGSLASVATTAATNKKNTEQFLENREYNTPANQMNRLDEAGINLNSAAGGVAGANTSASPSPLTEPSFDTSNLNNAVANSIQAKAVDSQSELNDAQTMYYKSQTKNLDIEATFKPLILQRTADDLFYRNEISKETLDFTKKNNPIMLELNRESVNQLKANTRYLDKQVDYLEEQKKLVIQEVKTSKSVEELNGVLKKYNVELMETEDAKQRNLDSQTTLNETLNANESTKGIGLLYDNAVKKVEAHFAKKNQELFDNVGITSAQSEVYDQYRSIRYFKGQSAADVFMSDLLNVTSANEAAVAGIRYYYSDPAGEVGSIMSGSKRASNSLQQEKSGAIRGTQWSKW